MKKKLLILSSIVFISVISNSCRQGCVCYADVYDPNLVSVFDATKKECITLVENLPIDTVTNTQFYTRCEWGKY